MFLTTLLLYAFKPQLKSFNFTPDVLRAAQLNNFEGKFLAITASYRFFFQPETRSYFCWVIMRYNSGISSGLSCKSASIVITTSPLAIAKPACNACDLPKFF